MVCVVIMCCGVGLSGRLPNNEWALDPTSDSVAPITSTELVTTHRSGLEAITTAINGGDSTGNRIYLRRYGIY